MDMNWGGPGYSAYDGFLKGGASQQEQAAADQQRQMETSLMQKQLAMQQQQIAGVNSAVDPIIAQGGMSPGQQAALTSQLTNGIPAQFSALQGQINNSLVARGITGGQNAGGGQIAQQFGQLGAMEAGLQQQGLSQIQSQKYQQLMQAVGAKMGVAGLYGQNTGLFNQGAGQALGQGVTAANNVDQAQGALMGSLIGAAGSLGTQAMKSYGPCWIARAVYGEYSHRAQAVREKLIADSETSYPHRIILGLYVIFGEPVAWFVKRSSVLQGMFRRVMDSYARPSTS